jgi:peptide-methionine (S)-S-oxide reductase
MKSIHLKPLAVSIITAIFFTCCNAEPNTNNTKSTRVMPTAENEVKNTGANSTDTATFGAGCFWCVEAVFQDLKGVSKVISGYSGGEVKNPSYKEVCTGTTGHAEVCQIIYDPKVISFDELLEVFWKVHDPTTLNRQGNDHGTQYRSVIFYHNENQKKLAEKYKTELSASGAFDNPVVTEISPFTAFYIAEDYHQSYFNQNGEEPYCKFVIQPKVDKFKKVFKDKLK